MCLSLRVCLPFAGLFGGYAATWQRELVCRFHNGGADDPLMSPKFTDHRTGVQCPARMFIWRFDVGDTSTGNLSVADVDFKLDQRSMLVIAVPPVVNHTCSSVADYIAPYTTKEFQESYYQSVSIWPAMFSFIFLCYGVVVQYFHSGLHRAACGRAATKATNAQAHAPSAIARLYKLCELVNVGKADMLPTTLQEVFAARFPRASLKLIPDGPLSNLNVVVGLVRCRSVLSIF